MPEVDGNTLVMAIQAVSDKLRALETARNLAGEDGADDYFEEIMAFDSAAQKLKVAYEHALKMANNLPPYEKLVAGGSGQ
jgi:hypothetical protein